MFKCILLYYLDFVDKNLFLYSLLELQDIKKSFIIALSFQRRNILKGEKKMRGFTNYVLKPLTFIGAINWGLIGLFGFDLVAFLFGAGSLLSAIVYSLVGIAAVVWLIIMLMDNSSRKE